MNDFDELDEASYSFFERLLLLICRFEFILYLVLVVESMLLLLAILSFIFADLDASTEVVLLLDFVLLAIAIVPTAVGLVLCNRR